MTERVLPLLVEQNSKLVDKAGRIAEAYSLYPDEPLERDMLLQVPEAETNSRMLIFDEEGTDLPEVEPSVAGHAIYKAKAKRQRSRMLAGLTLQTLLEINAHTGKSDIGRATWVVANKLRNVSIEERRHDITSKVKEVEKAFSLLRNSAHLCAAWMMVPSTEREPILLSTSGFGERKLIRWLNASDWFLNQLLSLSLKPAKNREKEFSPWRVPSAFKVDQSFHYVPNVSPETIRTLAEYSIEKARRIPKTETGDMKRSHKNN